MAHEYEPEPQGKSNFNEASFQISRLDDDWQACKRHRQNGNMVAWRWGLHNVWLELCYDAERLDGEKDADNKYYQKNKTFNKIIRRLFVLESWSALFLALTEYQEFLYKLQNASGKGGLYHEPQEIVF